MPSDRDGNSESAIRKKVDESWKDTVAKEKTGPGQGSPDREKKADGRFPFLVSSLAMQALMALGLAADPSGYAQEPDPAQARPIIDTLLLLQEKTKGNLTEQEETLLRNTLYELQTAFVQVNEKNK